MLAWGKRCSKNVEAICLCCISLAWLLFAMVFVLQSAFSSKRFNESVPMGMGSKFQRLEEHGAIRHHPSPASRYQTRPVRPKEHLWGHCHGLQLAENRKNPQLCLRQNLNYIRIPKTGSTTVMRTLWHIAKRHGLYGAGQELGVNSPSNLPQWEPFLLTNHALRQKKDRDLKKNVNPTLPMIYITFVREPVERMISAFYYFEVGLQNISASPKKLLKYLRKESGSFESDWLRRQPSSQAPATPEEILDDYDFVGVTERMDESMLLLQHELGLNSLCDVLYLNFKNSTAQNERGLVPHANTSSLPEKLRVYIESATFRDKMLPDTQLYAAANARIDRLIDKIGIKEFQKELAHLRTLQGKATAQCRKYRGCYYGDGPPCCLDVYCVDGR